MACKVEVVPATREHIKAIARNVREADRAELWAVAMLTPTMTMEMGLRDSVAAWTGLFDGVPVCMFGVCVHGVLVQTNMPWMVGTNLLDKYARVFLVRCRRYVDLMVEVCGTLTNYVDARNVRAIKWLKWLGFTIYPAQPYGMLGLPFHKFERKEDASCVE